MPRLTEKKAIRRVMLASSVAGWLALVAAACGGSSEASSCGDPPAGFGCRSTTSDCTPLECNEGTWVCPVGSDEVAIATATCDGDEDGGALVTSSGSETGDAASPDGCVLPTDCATNVNMSNCTYGPPHCEDGFGICGALMCDTVLGEASADPVVDSGSGNVFDSSAPRRDAGTDAPADAPTDALADAPNDG